MAHHQILLAFHHPCRLHGEGTQEEELWGGRWAELGASDIQTPTYIQQDVHVYRGLGGLDYGGLLLFVLVVLGARCGAQKQGEAQLYQRCLLVGQAP